MQNTYLASLEKKLGDYGFKSPNTDTHAGTLLAVSVAAEGKTELKNEISQILSQSCTWRSTAPTHAQDHGELGRHDVAAQERRAVKRLLAASLQHGASSQT